MPRFPLTARSRVLLVGTGKLPAQRTNRLTNLAEMTADVRLKLDQVSSHAGTLMSGFTAELLRTLAAAHATAGARHALMAAARGQRSRIASKVDNLWRTPCVHLRRRNPNK
jgi:hypothetical protein